LVGFVVHVWVGVLWLVGWLSGSRLAKTVWMAVVGSRGGKTDWRVVVGWFVGWVTFRQRQDIPRNASLVGWFFPGRRLIIASGICSVRQMMSKKLVHQFFLGVEAFTALSFDVHVVSLSVMSVCGR
jgi:hypothetical protein